MGEKKGFLRGTTEESAVSQEGKHSTHGAPGSHEKRGQGSKTRERIWTGHADEMSEADGRKE